MRNGGVNDLLERLLGLDLLVEDSKRDIFEVNNEGILPVVLDLLFEDTEDELLLILLLVRSKINICLLVTPVSGGVGTFK